MRTVVRRLLVVVAAVGTVVVRNDNIGAVDGFAPISTRRHHRHNHHHDHSRYNLDSYDCGNDHEDHRRILRYRSATADMKSTSTALWCQLLGMNCATPTDFTFSLKGFCRRGGQTDVHSDGWGLAFYEGGGNAIRQFHDTQAAATSPLAQFLSSQSMKTLNMMAHIRLATVGEVSLENVHPFQRELWGVQWAFAMNGDLPSFKTDPNMKLSSLGSKHDGKREKETYYHPVGETDSEAAFCAILNELRHRFDSLPSLPVLHQTINELCNEIIMDDPSGSIFNFLLTCGPHTLWCYSWPGSRPGSDVWNGLYYTTRKHPFSTASLKDCDHVVDFNDHTTEDSVVSVVATKPLTDDEEWTEIKRGELIVFDQGLPNITPESLFEIELLGRGLQSTALEKSVIEEDMRSFNLDPTNFQGTCI